MIIISSSGEMQAQAIQLRQKSMRIGLVPTMGFLHDGHMSLVRIARKMSDIVVLSSFVNPTQFGPAEDFNKYPRNEGQDDRLCELEGVDIVFRPSAGEMYAKDHSVYVEEMDLSSGLCGQSRPGHFRGVTTIVAKLFNIVLPQIAVFGRKDAQQARVIEQLVRDLNFPIKIVLGQIIREPDGLAMSSRNSYLSANERERAVGVYKSLCIAADLYRNGVSDTATISNRIRSSLEKECRPDSIDYIDIVDYMTLKKVDKIKIKSLIAVAVRIGHTRLIDNVVLPSEDNQY